MKVGEVYYPTGELYFVGRYDETAVDNDGMPYKFYAEVKFYKDGTVCQEGIFQWGGLYYGRLFYPSSALKFLEQFNDKHGTITGKQVVGYYGPSYPVEGTFYSEDGTILYQGKFQIRKLMHWMLLKVGQSRKYGKIRIWIVHQHLLLRKNWRCCF